MRNMVFEHDKRSESVLKGESPFKHDVVYKEENKHLKQ